jgi:hypothetical protein
MTHKMPFIEAELGAAALATVTALLGALLIAFGLWQKAHMAEGFLTVKLGADARQFQQLLFR